MPNQQPQPIPGYVIVQVEWTDTRAGERLDRFVLPEDQLPALRASDLVASVSVVGAPLARPATEPDGTLDLVRPNECPCCGCSPCMIGP